MMSLASENVTISPSLKKTPGTVATTTDVKIVEEAESTRDGQPTENFSLISKRNITDESENKYESTKKRTKPNPTLEEPTMKNSNQNEARLNNSDDSKNEQIFQPADNDYLFGGASTSKLHTGNKMYRKLVSEQKVEFMLSDRSNRNLLVKSLVRKWKTQDPPGRFLKRDTKTGLWYDVGDDRAKIKTMLLFKERAFVKTQFGMFDSDSYPMKEIFEPCDNDFLVSSGSSLNKYHAGNIKFCKLAKSERKSYGISDRAGKQQVVAALIEQWRDQDPPGRFLAKGKDTIFWHDVGDKKAEDKIRQFLRGAKNQYDGTAKENDSKPIAENK